MHINGQLITIITYLFEIPGVMSKDKVYEIVIFNLLKQYTTWNFFCKDKKKQLSPNVYWFWQQAFESLEMVHKNNLKICRSEAKMHFL